MRRLLAVLILCTFAPAWAQQPPRLEPLPEPPPPPPGVDPELPGEAPIRITPGLNEQVEEFNVNGRRVVRVTTPTGAVYYLLEGPAGPQGAGAIGRDFRVPLWLIRSF